MTESVSKACIPYPLGQNYVWFIPLRKGWGRDGAEWGRGTVLLHNFGEIMLHGSLSITSIEFPMLWG